MTCDELKVLLPEYWSHTLGEADELVVERHLGICDNCRAEVERLGTLWQGLSRIEHEEPGPNMRTRFYESLGAYRQGLESAPKSAGLWSRVTSFWPKQPAFQMGLSFAMMALGVGVGCGIRPGEKQQGPTTEVAQLRNEVSGMKQMVALSLMQQQSASERLRGVSYAFQAQSSDTEVLSALLATINQDANVNVRLAAVDALHTFGSSPVTRTAIIQSIRKQNAAMVQVALIDLLVDLKEKEAVPELRKLLDEQNIDVGVKQRAQFALGKLQ